MKWIKDLIGITELEKELGEAKKSIENLNIEICKMKYPEKFAIGDNVDFVSMRSRELNGNILSCYWQFFNGRYQRFYDIISQKEVFKGIAEYDITYPKKATKPKRIL